MPVRECRPRAGFTLIEVLMVLTLIGLITVIAAPTLDFTRYRLNGAARSMVSLMNRAQRQAITNQSNVNVIFDINNKAVTLHEDMNNNNQIDNGERTRTFSIGESAVYGLGTSLTTRLYSPAPVTFTRRLNGNPEVIFRRDGSASQAGAVYITSARYGRNAADTRSIEVIAATGRVEWYRYAGDRWERKF